MSPRQPPGARQGVAARARGLLAGGIRAWAYLGGALLLLITGLEAANAVGKLLTGSAHAAEHELVKYMVGIAIFSFLPWCQLQDGHIAVDLFTERISARAKHLLAACGAGVGGAIALLLLRQMSFGLQSYLEYREVTAVLHLPIWTAFPFVLISLALWALACGLSLATHVAAFRAAARKG